MGQIFPVTLGENRRTCPVKHAPRKSEPFSHYANNDQGMNRFVLILSGGHKLLREKGLTSPGRAYTFTILTLLMALLSGCGGGQVKSDAREGAKTPLWGKGWSVPPQSRGGKSSPAIALGSIPARHSTGLKPPPDYQSRESWEERSIMDSLAWSLLQKHGKPNAKIRQLARQHETGRKSDKAALNATQNSAASQNAPQEKKVFKFRHTPTALATMASPGGNGVRSSKQKVKGFEAHEPYMAGITSWYGPGFHGKKTANGEVYNQNGLTAAHPTLPMDTMIEVKNLDNGRKIWLRVNDRGPYKKGRILDLSKLAAQQLRIIPKGTGRVAIKVVRWPKSVLDEPLLKPYTQYVVQVAAYDKPEQAQSLRNTLARKFSKVTFGLDPRPNGYLGVIAGPYDRRDEALVTAKKLNKSGYKNMVRRLRK